MKNDDIGMSFHLNSKLYNSGQIEKATSREEEHLYTTKEIIKADFHLVQTNTIVFKCEYLSHLDLGLLTKSPVGDVWIRIATSIPDGALFINKDMATYRVQSSGSWSESIQSDTKFVIFADKMIKSIQEFDAHWQYRYKKEFRYYINIYLTIIMKKKSLDTEIKKRFISTHRTSMSVKNLLLWHLLYKHDTLVTILSIIKNNIKRGLGLDKTNN